MVEPKLLRLVFILAHSVLYRATPNVKVTLGSLPMKEDQNEYILLRTCSVMAAYSKDIDRPLTKKIKEKMLHKHSSRNLFFTIGSFPK